MTTTRVADGAARETIDEMVRRIVERFDPEQIILFGSYARGTAGPDSDVDLLVVMRVEGSRRAVATDIDLALFGVPLPADVIVVTRDELERDRHALGTTVYPALREGEMLYERRA